MMTADFFLPLANPEGGGDRVLLKLELLGDEELPKLFWEVAPDRFDKFKTLPVLNSFENYS